MYFYCLSHLSRISFFIHFDLSLGSDLLSSNYEILPYLRPTTNGLNHMQDRMRYSTFHTLMAGGVVIFHHSIHPFILNSIKIRY